MNEFFSKGPNDDESYGGWANRNAGLWLVVIVGVAILGSAILAGLD